jgi:hypothetical protein
LGVRVDAHVDDHAVGRVLPAFAVDDEHRGRHPPSGVAAGALARDERGE